MKFNFSFKKLSAKKPELNQDLDWLKKDLSDDFKQRVFNAVLPELEINKAQSHNPGLSKNWIWSLAASFALIAIIAIRISGQIEIGAPSTTFDDLALLTPEEFEVVENLDVLDKIENINLDEIRKEMKQKGNRS
jgi:hypothetical protein